MRALLRTAADALAALSVVALIASLCLARDGQVHRHHAPVVIARSAVGS